MKSSQGPVQSVDPASSFVIMIRTYFGKLIKQSFQPQNLLISRFKHTHVSKLVPHTGKVTLIKDGTPTLMSLKSIDLEQTQLLKIVDISPNGQGKDPTVCVKIVDQHHERRGGQNKAKKRASGPAEVKGITISWTISKNDLDGQKKQAISSVLSRGHNLQLQLRNKHRSREALSENQLESRKLLATRVKEMLDQLGSEMKQSTGSIQSEMVFYYRSK